MRITKPAIGRNAAAWMAGLLVTAAFGPLAHAQDVSGELVFLNWETGSQFQVLQDLEDAFTAKNPGVKFRNINLTVSGDQRGAIRTALIGGQKADLLTNTWPAFRKELADAGMLRPLDQQWDAGKWGDNIPDSWRKLGQIDGVTYGVTYTFGDRSGIFYRPDTLKKAGIDAAPKDWDEFKASFAKLNGIGVTPIAVPAKVWAQTEWFENLLLRTAGAEAAAKLARHEIPWTDPIVKTTLQKYAELLKANCCGDPTVMLATDWDNAANNVLRASTAGYELIGMWVNGMAKSDYALKEGVDYSLFQFPTMGAGHDDVSSVDSKEFVGLSSGDNPAAADAFLAFLGTAEAANIVAKHGLASPSNKVDASLYGPVTKIAVDNVAKSKVQFVLGDLLPGDLVDEYRVQLQKFLQNPTDATIDSVMTTLEAKAVTLY
ncbi:ABC transporter substrate-binding protein [Kaistia dalseonensis]|uniref:Multiple sugar transport system substrate-binding protein n=1 Tax=Kaistia dalseonensis TaxID=410840 RepID=A0ABU0H4V4_9HYPH|nr:ABC transporter substrate-binding protein [Kaistia dalseonensis]MCX5494763.1 ABC transporter substrate-binding protein [Kaistia dalseonensis]MDQ0437344.1 multiple sugar transport system substrate-binding protein [Kaistia dalseonensis]